jgi:phosphatidylserine/phosphatidylglycerophosphate/cardiolipin synthase-like enzyme
MKFNFFKNRTHTFSIAQSRLYDQNSFYSAFERSLLCAQSEVIIESPFITMRRLNALLPIFRKLRRKGVKIVINTKPPEEQDDFLRSQTLEAVPILQNLGANVYYTGGHHRKLAIIDRQILWEGSLNILSQGDSCEIMRKIESSDAVIEAMQLINMRGWD